MRGARGLQGFTLIELLIAMALIGIIFALITSWQTSAFNISTKTNATSQRLSDLNDLTGYVGDRVRAAIRVRVATSNLSVNGRDCTAVNPCLAVVLPQNTTTGVIAKYNLYVYRIEPRSLVLDADKVTDTWADSNVVVLREYRSKDADSTTTPATVASTPANCTPTAPATFDTDTSAACATMRGITTAGSTALTTFGEYLVADYLTPADGLGSGVAPFAYLYDGGSPAKVVGVRLNFQARQQVRGQTQLTPTTPYTLDVQARNLP